MHRPLPVRLLRWVLKEFGPALIIVGTAVVLTGALPIGPFAPPDWESGVPASRFPAYEQLEFRYAAVIAGGAMLVLWNLWNAARACGKPIRTSVRLMWPIVRRSRSGMIAGALSVSCIVLSPLVSGQMMGGGRYFMAGQFFLAAGVLLYHFTPPVALVLGRSSESTGDALKALNFSLMPYRYVALVPGRRVGGAYLSESSHNLRTPAFQSWRQQVEDLEKIVVLIIMDTREATEHVSYEVASILDQEHAGKTLWVTDVDGGMPALDAFGGRLSGTRIQTVAIQNLEAWMQAFKKILDQR